MQSNQSLPPAPTRDMPAETESTLEESEEDLAWKLVTVKELSPVLQADFEEAEENIMGWLNLNNETRVKEYLTKLLTQVKIASRILLAPDRINEQHAKKLITLWKCAKRRDVSDYFKKKQQVEKEHKVETTLPTTTPPTQAFPWHIAPTKILDFKASSTTPPLIADLKYEWLLEEGSWIPYTNDILQQIIEAKERNQKNVEVTIHETNYIINLRDNTQINSKSGTMRPIREVVSWGAYGPVNWRAWPGALDLILYINPSSCPFTLEVSDVMRAIQQGVTNYEIMEVGIVYNPENWLSYYTLREDYKKRIPKFEERGLWHGTDQVSAKLICAQGFKRDLFKNFNYGKGCYFARSPQLAIRSEYAKLDDNEKQTLLYSYVAVGDKIGGAKDMKQPPVKDENLLRYENTVDDLGSPKIYVTYDDHQAFAALVVQLKRKPGLADGELTTFQDNRTLPALNNKQSFFRSKSAMISLTNTVGQDPSIVGPESDVTMSGTKESSRVKMETG